MDLRHLIFILVLYLGTGVFVSLGFVRQKEIGNRYFLYHGLGLTALVGSFYLLLGAGIQLTAAEQGLMGAFMGFAVIFSFTAAKIPWLSWAAYGLGTASAIAVIVLDVETRIVTSSGLPSEEALYITNSLLSMGLLGFSMAAMLLGHWYLVQPKLSIHELSRISFILILLVIARSIFSTYFFSQTLVGKSELEVYRYLFSSTPGIFLIMRWAWGILAPLILCYLIWNTVKIRSTQSATGILYVAVLCVLTGETMSQYLAFFHALPL